MYPSLETWTLTELEARQQLLNQLGVTALIVFTLAGLFGGLWWNGYKERISEQIVKLQNDARDKKIAETKKLIPENTGLLLPGNGDTPEVELPEGTAPPEMVVLLGEFAAVAHRFPYAVVTQDGEPLVVLNKTDEGLSLSAMFFDKNGKIVCEIDNNRFQTNPENVFKIKRTPHRLEVFNDEARKILDLEYINERTVRILGDFYFRDGYHVTIKTGEMDMGGVKMIGGSNFLNGIRIWTKETNELPEGIVFRVPTIKSLNQKELTVKLPMVAGGNLPTRILKYEVGISASRAGNDLEQALFDLEEHSYVINPTELIAEPGVIHNLEFGGDFDDSSVLEAIQLGKADIWVIGRVRHEDRAGIKHVTQACYSYNFNAIDKGFVKCEALSFDNQPAE